jgi:hypothetical protein
MRDMHSSGLTRGGYWFTPCDARSHIPSGHVELEAESMT